MKDKRERIILMNYCNGKEEEFYKERKT